MSSIFHTHKKAIMIVVMVPIGVSMLFFGLSGPTSTSNQGADFTAPIAQVGNVNITATEFIRHYNREAKARAVNGTEPSPQELAAAGVVDHIVDDLIKLGVFRAKAQESGLTMDKAYLDEAFKKYSDFQTNGQYDAIKWNNFVERKIRQNVDWNQQYAIVNRDVQHRLLRELTRASVRVPDRELKTLFDQSVAKIRVRVATIEPKVEQDEQVYIDYYNENKFRYLTNEERVVEFVAFSIKALIPDLAHEIVERARAGEDFAELAKAYSESITKDKGGDLGWVTESASTRVYEAPLFDLEAGDISEPIQVGTTVRVYKIEDKRTLAPDDTREIRLSEIQLNSYLDLVKKQTQQDLAELMVVVANDSDDFRAALEQEGLEVLTTDSFAQSDREVENVDPLDTVRFVPAMSALKKGEISGVITGAHNLYVARVREYTKPAQQTFEEAREKLLKTVDASYKRSNPDYQAQVSTYIAGIAEKANSLDEIQTLYPELELTIKDSGEFGRNDTFTLIRNGLMIEAAKLIDPLVAREPGTMVGPISSFGSTYFAELVERVDLDEETYAQQWAEQEPLLRTNMEIILKNERSADYLLHLGERAISQGIIQRDNALIEQVLGLNQPETPAPADPAPAPTATTPAPDSEGPTATTAEPAQETTP